MLFLSHKLQVGASPRHLSTSRGLADLTIGTANFPPLPLESEAIPAQITKPLLQEREIEHSDVVRYYALLLLCPEGHCNVLLYSISMSGIEEPHIRAIINLHKATLVSCSMPVSQPAQQLMQFCTNIVVPVFIECI